MTRKAHFITLTALATVLFGLRACAGGGTEVGNGLTAELSGRVVSLGPDGKLRPLAGAVVRVGTQIVRTSGDGRFSVAGDAPVAPQGMIEATRIGYASAVQPYRLDSRLGQYRSGTFITVTMLEAATGKNVSVANGGTLIATDSQGRAQAVLALPPAFASLESDDVYVSLGLIRPQVTAEMNRMPGLLQGLERNADVPLPIQPFGAIAVDMYSGEEHLDGVRLTRPATLQLRIDPSRGASLTRSSMLPGWSLDAATGNWQAGTQAAVIAQNGDEYVQWQVSHFSWWGAARAIASPACAAVQLIQSGDAPDPSTLRLRLDGASFDGNDIAAFDREGVAVVYGPASQPNAPSTIHLRIETANGGLSETIFEQPAPGRAGLRGTFVMPDQPAPVGSQQIEPASDCLYVQTTPRVRRGEIRGTAMDTDGYPASGATVTLVETGQSVAVNAEGVFVFADAPWDESGAMQLHIEAVDAEGVSHAATQLVRDRAAQHVSLRLNPAAIPPVFIASTVDNASPLPGASVRFTVAVESVDPARVTFAITTAAGRVENATVSAEPGKRRTTLRGTWTGVTAAGVFPLTVTATAGNGESATTVVPIRVGAKPPVIVASAPAFVTADTSVSVAAEGIDADGQTVAMVWSLDDAPVTPVDGSIDVAAGAEGSVRRIEIRASTAAASTAQLLSILSASSSAADGPDTVLEEAPAETTTLQAPEFRFSSPAHGATFGCSLDDSPFAACVTPLRVGALTAGRHSFAVRAIDPDGKADPTPAFVTWKIVPPSSPATGSWVALPVTGAPDPRFGHGAVWTGSRMIVWGGRLADDNFAATGGSFDPGTGTWTSLPVANAPEKRMGHTAIWTGSRMIVWGGETLFPLSSGGLYDPQTDTWTITTPGGAPAARSRHTAVWTGSRMIVFGGRDAAGNAVSSGASYDPQTNTWTAIAGGTARWGHAATWTGTSMLVFGGVGQDGQAFDEGESYDPITGAWTKMSAFGQPSARSLAASAWTSTEWMFFGGLAGSDLVADGGRYNAGADTWLTMPAAGAPEGRAGGTAVWTANRFIVWGGLAGEPIDTGGVYDPAGGAWLRVEPSGAPAGRELHTSVWTGSEMIVFGGRGRGDVFNNGGRFRP